MRHVPIALQAAGALSVAFGVGVLYGLGAALVVFGAEAITAGTLAEADAQRASREPAKRARPRARRLRSAEREVA